MLTLIFTIMMFVVFGKLIGLAFKMTWGIVKVVFTLIFLPVILIGCFAAGLAYIALIALFIIGIITLITSLTAKAVV